MNEYCNRCSESCKEIIPTYNCKIQNMVSTFDLEKENNQLIGALKKNLDILYMAADKPKSAMVNSVDSVVDGYNSLTLVDKRTVFQKLFGLGFLSESIDTKLILLSLIGSFYIAAKANNPEITVMDAVNKLIDKDAIGGSYTYSDIENYCERLAILAEEFVFNVKTGNTFGLKDAMSLKSKVNEIIQQRTPF